MGIQFSRQWAMPNADTFDIPPIREFVKKYLRGSKVSIDPFARNKRWATYTNDLNPDTAAEYHMDALAFLEMLKVRGVVADLVVFDPPYSATQIKEVYDSIGGRTYRAGEQNWVKERDLVYQILDVGGICLSFGWDTNGLGRNRKTEIEEILLVPHGAAHNDTICMAERKIAHQCSIFPDDLFISEAI